ncbi:transcriptional activator NhaR [Aestuariibacter sp. AA17]|uniref:Transcriptional activator NhaR n=1 Tax=Fluctibacter corallii TaxID=2984329 RepID=A0ABT3A3K8_9ALTE|nr:transcriptional activator NhaR [Aestuariibacter sp. AA17]MCV2883238.1 transcriptional activator NhaR [Aestuariibacter sp. AA17]
MKQLNYHHLNYFYHIAREGSIAAAAKRLNLTPQTLSGQLASFEDYLGMPLFERKGKRLLLNEQGKHAYDYAEDIFRLGDELQQTLSSKLAERQLPLSVGITDVIPKRFAFEFLSTAYQESQSLKLICKEGKLDHLLAEMLFNKLDIIISDCAIPPGSKLKAYSHLINDSGLTFFASHALTKNLSGPFPDCLDGQPLLLPSEQSSIRINLLSWMERHGIKPIITAEFDDSALMKYFGNAGIGIFCAPTIVEHDILIHHQVDIIGRTEDVREQLYLISTERKIKHPAIVKLLAPYNKHAS